MKSKYEIFCRSYVANGDNATQAYYDAGYKPRSGRSANTLGAKLLKNIEIQQRIADLKAEILEESKKALVMSATEKRELLAKIMQDRTVAMSDRLKAIDIDNKMTGEYITKTQVSGIDGGPIVFGWQTEVSDNGDEGYNPIFSAPDLAGDVAPGTGKA